MDLGKSPNHNNEYEEFNDEKLGKADDKPCDEGKEIPGNLDSGNNIGDTAGGEGSDGDRHKRVELQAEDTEAMASEELGPQSEEAISERPYVVDYKEFEELKRQYEETFAKLQRLAADYQNYKKRVAEEKKKLVDQAELTTIETFVFPLIDDIDRALQAAVEHGYSRDDPLYQGLELVRDHAFKLLKQYGIEPIDAVGKEFDPLYHEAIAEQPASDLPPRTVLYMLNRGYLLNGRTIRPAKVVVSKVPETSKGDGDSEGK